MFLKHLEIEGFKSFPDKVKLDFSGGITAVVGPNGSGKSNIADAFRWVMGEQSAKSLRGSKMDDVIFIGTEHRRALPFAEVNMLIDNSTKVLPIPFSEVKITRRVGRNGDGEYLINDTVCRMRDIRQLFMDTGVGREGYSIIGQGRVDEILSSKSEDRRHLFEEAAGIVKYKMRRQETLAKLDAEKMNLERVNDLMQEMTTQMQPLEQQAKQAQKYLALQEKYKIIHINLFLQEVDKTIQEEKNLQANLTKITAKINEEEQKLSAVQKELETIRNQQESHEESYKTLNRNIITQVQAIEKAESNLKLSERIIKELTERTEQVTQKQLELQAEDEQRQQLQIAEQTAQEHLQKTEKLYQELGENLKKLEADLEAEQNIYYAQKEMQLQQKINVNTLTIAKFNNSSEELRVKIAEIDRQINEKTSRQKILSEMERAHEGYFSSVRAVMQQKYQNKEFGDGIIAPVSELITVPQKYETAIAIALGSSAQNILTNTPKDASRAIAFLKTSGAGRATFLPISEMKPRHVTQEMQLLLQERGVIGLANRIISFDDYYSPVFGYLLGNIFVLETLQRATELAKRYRQAYRLVTLDGDVISPGGAMTGGSRSNQSAGLLGRNRQIEELSQEIQTLQQQASQLKTEQLENATTKQRAEQETIQLKQDLQIIALEKMQKTQEAYKKHQEHSQKMQESTLTQLTDSKIKLNQVSQTLQTALTNVQRLSTELTDLQNQQSKLQLELANISQNSGNDNDDGDNENPPKINITENPKTSEDMQKKRLALLTEQLAEQQQQLATFEQDIQELRTATLKMENDRNSQAEILAQLNKESALLSAKKENITAESDRLNAEILENYNLTYQTAQEFRDEKYTVTALRREERRLKSAINELGTVNLGAIAAYSALEERHNFLKTQRDDILNAENQLRKIINELTTQMEQQFQAKFTDIAKHFNDVFKEMFGGGKATLTMTDPANVLESGIEIIVHPPGKKVQNLSLLSGGERALTAIALLFGILRMKPSPFCILDEIEAALDDANVIRFAHFLQGHGNNTQFVVITHRKGTMEAADTLYGVTMQELGISKIVSVSFN
ncbi:MAG: chromosome segregation protein SMC [Defluviitaleaceae bacterium]|nr:chromosome segregation protein SMC [Defluviitaleaceae bacterium]